MTRRNVIFALDLGVRTGFCYGARGDDPRATINGFDRLKTKDEPADAAYCKLLKFLSRYLSELGPMLVVKERMLPLQAFSNLGNAEHVVTLSRGLHAIVEGMCRLHGIEWKDAPDATVRKHFIGQGRVGKRTETKRAVVKRAQLLGYIRTTCADEDVADACAIFDWASHTPPNELFLFGEEAA